MRSSTSTQLGEIAIALLGLWLAVPAIAQLVTALGLVEELLGGGVGFVYFLPFVFSGICGVLLVVFRRQLARALFGSAGDSDDPLSNDVTELRPFLVAILGCFFVASGVVDAAQTEAESLLYPSPELSDSLFGSGRSRALLTTEAWLSRVPYVAEILVGLVLFVSSGRIVEIWTRARSAGRIR